MKRGWPGRCAPGVWRASGWWGRPSPPSRAAVFARKVRAPRARAPNPGRAIRVPVNRAWKIQQLRRAAAQLAQATGTEPTLDNIAAATGVPPRVAAGLLRDGQSLVSLHTPAAPR